MESKTMTISEMDEKVRTAISHAREQLKTDKALLASLEAWIRLWQDLCYQLVMSYTGLSLMRLVTTENAGSIFQIAHRFVPQNARTNEPIEISKLLSACMN